jgi:hypothetical protein
VIVESLNVIVDVEPVRTSDSEPDRTAPEILTKAPLTTELAPETEPPPTLVSVTVDGEADVVMENELDVYPANVATAASTPAAVRPAPFAPTVTGTVATMIVYLPSASALNFKFNVICPGKSRPAVVTFLAFAQLSDPSEACPTSLKSVLAKVEFKPEPEVALVHSISAEDGTVEETAETEPEAG